MGISRQQNAPLTLQQKVGLAACNLINLGYEAIPMEDGEALADSRSHKDRMSQAATYNWFLNRSKDIHIALKTGPSSGLVGITLDTYDTNSGLHAIAKKGFINICHDTLIRYERFEGEELQGVAHTLIFSCGKESFLGTKLDEFPGVYILPSETIVPIPPWTFKSKGKSNVSFVTSYECKNTVSPTVITQLPKDFRAAIRSAERRSLKANRQPQRPGGVRKELYDPVTEGGRNNALARRAGYLMRVHKLDEEQLVTELQIINQRCCQPPLDTREVRNTARSIFKKHCRHG